jgi:hypothetical protein
MPRGENAVSPPEPLVPEGYLRESRRPLQILIFLLPLVIAYEIGLALFLRSEDGVVTNLAHRTILRLFSVFGVSDTGGLFLGGIAIIVVLLLWHLLARDPWRWSLRTAGLMAVESLVLTLPLLLLAQAINDLATPLAGGGAPGGGWSQMGLPAKMAISVGAGLYEELLFRMMLIAVIHTLLVDVGRASHGVGAAVAVLVSAAAFTLYHPLGLETDPDHVSWKRVLFFFAAGLYFGAVYLWRGFGIVVAVHALYDILTVWLTDGEG